jgi:hypothetical protein
VKAVGSVSGRDLGEVDEADNRLTEETDDERARRLADLILPELFASIMPRTRPDAPFQLASLMVPSKRYEATRAAEPWRQSAGEVTDPRRAEAQSPVGTGTTPGARPGVGVEGRLVTELSAGDLGRIRLVIERTDEGLKVSLAVENAVLAASATAQRALLEQSLRASGLRVASVVVSHSGGDGTVLAQPPIANRRGGIDVTDEGNPIQEKVSGRGGRSTKRLNVTG